MEDIFAYERQEGEDYYRIVGCDELSSCEQILAEYKQRALECHPDKHPDDPTAVERFAQLQCAKGVLCDTKSRADYDKWRRSGLALTYRDWCAKRDSVHASMHWAVKKQKEPMLEEGPSCGQAETSSGKQGHGYDMFGCSTQSETESSWLRKQWKHDAANDVLSKFRNYEI